MATNQSASVVRTTTSLSEDAVHLSTASVEVEGRSLSLYYTLYKYPSLPPPFHTFSEARITGRYPDVGYVVNKDYDEFFYVVEGTGVLNTFSGKIFPLKRGDVVVVPKNTPFYYYIGELEGLRLLIQTDPKFSPKQHSRVNP